MNIYRVVIKIANGATGTACLSDKYTTIDTTPLRNESEARGWAIAWWNTKFDRRPEDFIYPIIISVTLLKRGVVSHDLSSGTCES